MEELNLMGEKARLAARKMAKLDTNTKNNILNAVADALVNNQEYIIAENLKDYEKGQANGMKAGLLDRLKLDEKRILAMAEGLRQLVSLDDPIGEVLEMKKRPNGLKIAKAVVPLGVIAIIFEARPNVTADAFGLCFKSGNAVILRGGSDAINSSIAIVEVIRKAIKENGADEDCVQLITDTTHESVNRLMKLNQYIDVIIPRGGASLIRNVVNNSTVPVIETGTGNCHIFIDESANLDMAVDIIENAKTQRIGVCNACESLVIHQNIADKAIPMIVDRLKKHDVEVRGCEKSMEIDSRIVPATLEDYKTEYLDYIISVKVVSDIDMAIEHINENNTGHSESIITESYANSQKFLEEIDAACVYVNASTRFTDGFEFGFGAEIGISTQKLHARGPMGLKELTTTKYLVYGDGQIRK